jgi:hypothetical protein
LLLLIQAYSSPSCIVQCIIKDSMTQFLKTKNLHLVLNLGKFDHNVPELLPQLSNKLCACGAMIGHRNSKLSWVHQISWHFKLYKGNLMVCNGDALKHRPTIQSNLQFHKSIDSWYELHHLVFSNDILWIETWNKCVPPCQSFWNIKIFYSNVLWIGYPQFLHVMKSQKFQWQEIWKTSSVWVIFYNLS